MIPEYFGVDAVKQNSITTVVICAVGVVPSRPVKGATGDYISRLKEPKSVQSTNESKVRK